MGSPVYRFLTSDGLVGTASNTDITGAADVHWTAPPADETWEIARIIINLRDAGTVNADTFGGISALTNGCLVQVLTGVNSVEKVDLLDGLTLKNNGDFARHCYDLNISSATSGDKAVTVRWTFSKSGAPVTLRGGTKDKLVFTTQDTTTGLSEFTVMAQGKTI